MIPIDFEPLASSRQPCSRTTPSPTSSLIIISDDEDGETGSPLRGLSSSLVANNPVAPSFSATSPGANQSKSTPSHPSQPRLYAGRSESSEAMLRPTQETTTTGRCRQLKPLMSYMDGFTETARHATQIQGDRNMAVTQGMYNKLKTSRS